MAIATTSNKTLVLGTGALTVFNFNFTVRRASDIVVLYVDANGNETDVTANCVIALNAVAAGAQWAVGGTITYNPGGVPIANTTYLAIVRTMPYTQLTQFANQGGNFPAVTEQTDDMLEMAVQQLYEMLQRAPLISQGKDQSLYTLTLAPVANALIGWDATGKVLGTVAGTGVNVVLPGAAGIAVYTGGSAFTSRTITAGQGIAVANGTGVAGNPTISIAPGSQVLVDANPVVWNANLGMVGVLTATGAVGALRTVNAPTNMVAGAYYEMRFIQDATGGRGITWGATVRGPNGVGTPPQPSQMTTLETVYTFWSPDAVNLNMVYLTDELARPNLLINPNWQIDQINEGALYTVTGGSGNVQGPDGWTGVAVAAPGVFKVRTLADPDDAALKCLEITCTTIDAAIGAADDYHIEAAIEGYDAAALAAGTAFAQSITIQFKLKISLAGVYGVSIANSAKNRSYVGIITVPDANEHEYSLAVPMDTAGTWLYTNGVGLYLRLTLAAGANFQTAAGAWGANNMLTTAAQANFMSNVANIAYLKRISLVPGVLPQSYKPADFWKDLAKAQRYYFKTIPQGTAVATGAGVSGAAMYQVMNAVITTGVDLRFPATMRASPTLTTYNPTSANAKWRNTTDAADQNVLVVETTAEHSYLQCTDAVATERILRLHVSANARLS